MVLADEYTIRSNVRVLTARIEKRMENRRTRLAIIGRIEKYFPLLTGFAATERRICSLSLDLAHAPSFPYTAHATGRGLNAIITSFGEFSLLKLESVSHLETKCLASSNESSPESPRRNLYAFSPYLL